MPGRLNDPKYERAAQDVASAYHGMEASEWCVREDGLLNVILTDGRKIVAPLPPEAPSPWPSPFQGEGGGLATGLLDPELEVELPHRSASTLTLPSPLQGEGEAAPRGAGRSRQDKSKRSK